MNLVSCGLTIRENSSRFGFVIMRKRPIFSMMENALTTNIEDLHETVPVIKTYQVEDASGQVYEFEPEQLIRAAQHCIQERFVMDRPQMNGAESAKAYIQVLIGHYQHEVFMALWLDNKHKLIRHEVMFRGTIDSAAVYPREVVKAAIRYNAAAVIFAHNHPSGCNEESESDIHITKKLKEALALIDIRLLDHLIVGKEVKSLAEQGRV